MGILLTNNESTLDNVKHEVKNIVKTVEKIKTKVQDDEEFINNESNLTLDDVKKIWKDILEIFKARRLIWL